MSEFFDPRDWRPAPFLPDARRQDSALVFVIAVLCFLACLTALGVLASDRASRGWASQLMGEATVIIRPKGNESPDTAAARAAEALAGAQGVMEARAIERQQAEALIAPWLGPAADLEDLPIPRLVAVTLDPAAPATATSLDQALKAAGIDGVVDDHSMWIRDIRSAAETTRWAGFAMFAVIAAAAAAVIAFATRAGLAARRDVVEVLHLTGAEDRFIANLFQVRFARTAAIAGLIGASCAAAVGALYRIIGGGSGLTPVLPVAWSDLVALAPCPLAAALVAAAAARLTAAALIRELT